MVKASNLGLTAEAEAAAGISARLERLPFTTYQVGIFGVIATAWFFDSIDLGSLTFLLGPIKTEFHLSAAQAGLLSSISFLGMFFGAASSGVAADWFGRKALFQVSMIFWGVGSISCGLAHDAHSLEWSRLLVGFGMGMEFPVAQALASEFTPASHRGRYIALLEGFWPLGFIAAGLVALWLMPVAGWRGVFIAEGVPAVFLLIVRRVVPESARWLADRGRIAKADEVLSRIEREVERRYGKALPEPQPLAPIPTRRGWTVRFAELWSALLLRRTLMLWALWFFALLGYYGLTTWLSALLQQSGFPVTKSVYFTVLISLAGIPGFLASSWLVEAWGRRPTCVVMLLGAAIAAYFYGTAQSQEHLLGFGLVMQFCLFGMWSVLYAYTPELYPTRLRATGAGFASAVGRLGSVLGPFAVGLALPTVGHAGIFAFGAGAFICAAVAVLLFGVETKGRRLEDIAI